MMRMKNSTNPTKKEDFIFTTPLFIADVHLGTLARYLRLAGFDTYYENNFSNDELVYLAIADNRTLLSRKKTFTSREQLKFFHITHEDPKQQFELVFKHFRLKEFFHPFTRCLACNHDLIEVSKETIRNQLELQTVLYYNHFWQCKGCRKVYWKGSHYQRMKQFLDQFS